MRTITGYIFILLGFAVAVFIGTCIAMNGVFEFIDVLHDLLKHHIFNGILLTKSIIKMMLAMATGFISGVMIASPAYVILDDRFSKKEIESKFDNN